MKVDIELTDNQVLTLAGTIGTCMLIGLEQHLPPHKALARKIQAVEKAIAGLYGLIGEPVDGPMIDIGARCWGAAMKELAKELEASK